MIRAADIETEHRLALESLNSFQRRAIARLADARREVHFNGRSEAENLSAIFEREASVRTARLATA